MGYLLQTCLEMLWFFSQFEFFSNFTTNNFGCKNCQGWDLESILTISSYYFELTKVLGYVTCNHQSSLIFVIQFHRFLVNKCLWAGHPFSNFPPKKGWKLKREKKQRNNQCLINFSITFSFYFSFLYAFYFILNNTNEATLLMGKLLKFTKFSFLSNVLENLG
jgi:hypothetical protein